MARRGPNTQLIEGARNLGQSKGFLDIGGIVGESFKGAEASMQYSANEKKKQVDANNEITNRVNSYMGSLKTDMDFTGFSPAETASMRNFLLAERSKYADAAKAISRLDDASSPEYMQYVDIMQGVNNSFTNLASQIKSYKTSKLEYAQDQLSATISLGNDPMDNEKSAKMYGLYNSSKDKKSDAKYDSPMLVKDGGFLAFNIDGEEMNYDDSPKLLFKDYGPALSILKTNESIYTAGRKITSDQAKMYRMGLEKSLENPEALASLVSDFDDTLPFGDVEYKPKDPNFNIVALRKTAIDRLVNAYVSAGERGAIEKENRRLGRNRPEENSKITWIPSTKNPSLEYEMKDGKPTGVSRDAKAPVGTGTVLRSQEGTVDNTNTPPRIY